jgi:hypothetical protein
MAIYKNILETIGKYAMLRLEWIERIFKLICNFMRNWKVSIPEQR